MHSNRRGKSGAHFLGFPSLSLILLTQIANNLALVIIRTKKMSKEAEKSAVFVSFSLEIPRFITVADEQGIVEEEILSPK